MTISLSYGCGVNSNVRRPKALKIRFGVISTTEELNATALLIALKSYRLFHLGYKIIENLKH